MTRGKKKPKIIKDYIWIDIETVPLWNKKEDADPLLLSVFENKYCKDKPDDKSVFEWYYERAGLFAEFSKIVCISYGKVVGGELKVGSICSDNEKELLQKFDAVLGHPKMYYTNNTFAGFNIINYDCPFIAKRMIIHGMQRKRHLSHEGKKSRDIDYLDVMNLWQMGGGYSAGLETIAVVLGLPTPKEQMDGKEVKNVYYSNDPERFEKIKSYCELDVKTAYIIYKKINDTKTAEY